MGRDFYVGLYRTEHPERLRTTFARHLAWATEQEAAGRIFLTGPLTPPDREASFRLSNGRIAIA